MTTQATPERIRTLIEDLESDDLRTRESAREELVAVGEPAVEPLIALLAHREHHVRWEAFKALVDVKSPSAIPTYLAHLADEDPDMHWFAAEGLVAIGCDVAPLMLQMLIDGIHSRRLRRGVHHVLHALAHQKRCRPVRRVLDAFDGEVPDMDVPRAAHEALSEIRRAAHAE